MIKKTSTVILIALFIATTAHAAMSVKNSTTIKTITTKQYLKTNLNAFISGTQDLLDNACTEEYQLSAGRSSALSLIITYLDKTDDPGIVILSSATVTSVESALSSACALASVSLTMIDHAVTDIQNAVSRY